MLYLWNKLFYNLFNNLIFFLNTIRRILSKFDLIEKTIK